MAQDDGTSTRLVGLNRHGDLGYQFTTTGAVTDTTVYDPFGVVAAVTGSGGSPLGFQADYTDPATDQVWMGTRWYSPAHAGFTSRDTMFGELRTPVSLNRYTYAAANPLLYWDPDGRYGERVEGIATHSAMQTGDSLADVYQNRGLDLKELDRASREHVARMFSAADSIIAATEVAAQRANQIEPIKRSCTWGWGIVRSLCRNVGGAAADVYQGMDAGADWLVDATFYGLDALGAVATDPVGTVVGIVEAGNAAYQQGDNPLEGILNIGNELFVKPMVTAVVDCTTDPGGEACKQAVGTTLAFWGATRVVGAIARPLTNTITRPRQVAYAHTPGPRSVALDSSTARALTSADQTVARRLKSQLSGCNLVMCQTAVDEFQGAVARLAGPSEKAAADALMRRVTVVPDNPSARVAGLRLTGSVQPNDIQIFGTADRMGIPIFTSDAAFLRGATGQGVWLDAYVHPSVSFRGL